MIIIIILFWLHNPITRLIKNNYDLYWGFNALKISKNAKITLKTQKKCV